VLFMLQTVCIAADASSTAAALAVRSDVTHIFFMADAAASSKQLAAAHAAFQDIVQTARDAGAQLQQAHLSLVQPGQSPVTESTASCWRCDPSVALWMVL
jgi:hypothetical protein